MSSTDVPDPPEAVGFHELLAAYQRYVAASEGGLSPARTPMPTQDQFQVDEPPQTPTTPTAGNNLPTQTDFLAELQVEECPICYENLIDPIKTACNHTFCLDCATTWFRTSNTCPTCRTALYKSEERARRFRLFDSTFNGLIREEELFSFGYEAFEFVLERINDVLGPDHVPFGEAEARELFESEYNTGPLILLEGGRVYTLQDSSSAFQYGLRRYIALRVAQEYAAGLSFTNIVESFDQVVQGVNTYMPGIGRNAFQGAAARSEILFADSRGMIELHTGEDFWLMDNSE